MPLKVVFKKIFLHWLRTTVFCMIQKNISKNTTVKYHLSAVLGTVISRVCPRFFDQDGHETMYAFSGNKHFFTKSSHHQTYQNYEQS